MHNSSFSVLKFCLSLPELAETYPELYSYKWSRVWIRQLHYVLSTIAGDVLFYDIQLYVHVICGRIMADVVACAAGKGLFSMYLCQLSDVTITEL